MGPRFGIAIVLAGASASAANMKWTDPYPGIHHLEYSDGNLPLRVHLVTVDLSSQEIHLRATPSAERGRTVSDFATCAGAGQGCVKSEVAVNGDLFAPLGFVPASLAIGDRAAWADAAKVAPVEGWLAFGRPVNDLNAVVLAGPGAGAPPKSLDADGAVSGRPQLIADGVALGQFDCADASEPCRPKARTAVGLDMLGVTMFLAVVDGDQQASVGLSAADLAAFLADQGAWNAVALDGGGSSAMYIAGEGGLVSKPSDGVERPVANHLGVHQGTLPHCAVVGFVFDKVLGGAKITNATVTLDGKTGTWDGPHQLFNFTDVEPHRVCVVARAPGYLTGEQCKQITLSDIMQDSTQYDSVVLQPGTDPPDMARPPADMAQPARDLGHTVDRGVRADAGGDGGDLAPITGGCGCALGRGKMNERSFIYSGGAKMNERSFIYSWLLAAALLGLILRRKRRP